MHGERVTILNDKKNQNKKQMKKQQVRKKGIARTKIWQKLIFCCTISFVIACLVGYMLNYVGRIGIIRYVDNAVSEKAKTDRIIDEFQEYVWEQKLSIYDNEKVYEWIETKKDIDIYFSGTSEIVDLVEQVENQYQDTIVDVGLFDFGLNGYDISFVDGNIKGFVILYDSEKYYDLLYLCSLLVGACVFVLVLLKLVKKRLAYVVTLADEMKILEGGNLEYEITVEGNDEVAFLGKSINEMRMSVIEKMQKEKAAIQANEELITAMSHDIRTPLTKQIGYLEILEREKYSDENQKREYISKAKNNAYLMKDITDKLFRYFLAFSNQSEENEWHIMDGIQLFGQVLSDQCDYMIAQGFDVSCELVQTDFICRVKLEEFIRVFDNLFSNVQKYADKNRKITISNCITVEKIMIILHNYSKKEKNEVESTKIGLTIVKNFMKHMNGDINIVEMDNEFEVTLSFPIELKTK